MKIQTPEASYSHSTSWNVINYMLLACFFLAFCMPAVSALKINTDYSLVITSDNATSCNLTAIHHSSDGSFKNFAILLNKSGSTFSSTISSSNFSLLGETCMYVTCFDPSASPQYSSGSKCIDIDATGTVQTTSQGIGSAIYLILILSLTVLFGFLGFRLIQSDKLKILGILFLFLGVLFIIYDVWLSYLYYLTFTGLSDARMPETIFYIFLLVLVGGLLVSGALLFTRWKEVFKWFKHELKRKENDQDEDIEDWDLSKYSQGVR